MHLIGSKAAPSQYDFFETPSLKYITQVSTAVELYMPLHKYLPY